MNFNPFDLFRRKNGKELDLKKFKIDENRSNPMVVAQQYPDCPINEICFYMVVGFGSVPKVCPHLKQDKNGKHIFCKKL